MSKVRKFIPFYCYWIRYFILLCTQKASKHAAGIAIAVGWRTPCQAWQVAIMRNVSGANIRLFCTAACKQAIYLVFFKIMVVEKVTKKMLFQMDVGDQKVFTLPSWNKARSAQSYANQIKKATLGTRHPREFRAVIGDPNPIDGQTGVTITRTK